MLKEENTSFLKNAFRIWDKLSNEEQELLLHHTSVVHYQQGECIHHGENDCVGVILVKSGCIRSYMLSDKGKEVTLYRLYSGDICILSASCLLQNITFDIHVDAQEDSEVLLIHSAAFSKLMASNVYVENFSYKMTMEKFSEVMWAMEQILFMSFDKRLAIFLLDEATKSKSPTIKLTHEQIAKYIGSAREVVSRMLKYFASEGWVELSRGGMTLINVQKLKELIQ